MPYHHELTMSEETISPSSIKLTSLLGAFVALGFFALIGVYSVRMTQDYPDYDQNRATERYATLAKLRQDEGKLINPVDADGKSTAEWVDQAHGVIRIPIEEAMTKELDTLKAEAPAAGCEIPGAVPPAPAPAATAPAPAAPAAAKTSAPAPAGNTPAVAKTPATPSAPAPAKPNK
jgi:hypothetical protein